MTAPNPDWLRRAWVVRAVILTVVLGGMALLLHARWQMAGDGGQLAQSLPLLFVAVLGLAVWADWAWLKRNHHRVNGWGLSRGKDARKKPK